MAASKLRSIDVQVFTHDIFEIKNFENGGRTRYTVVKYCCG